MFFIGTGDVYWVDAGFTEELRPKKKGDAAEGPPDTGAGGPSPSATGS
jgi:hypothetical protein